MRFRILGPMEVTGEPPEEQVVTPRAAKLRIVLASLLVRADRVVSVDTLADELWGDTPPRTPTATIQVYVSHLRKTLQAADPRCGREALITQSPGYVLRPQPGQLDLTDFEELHDRGRRALDRGDYAAASDLHRRALALWRGPMLVDTPHGALLGGAAAWVCEVRVSALEQRVRADLQLGRHHELINELRALVAEHPLREELHAHLMLALFRAERQTEALRVFARLRTTLIDELGTEPGPPVQRLHQRILAEDRELMAPGPAAAAPPSAPLPGPVTAGLPAADPAFTGRTAQLTEVEQLLRRAPAGSCVALTGPAGVGKTALAVEAAHRTADAFPDGRIFLNLHPPGRGPLSAAEAMVRLLRRADARDPLPTDPEDLRDLVQRLLAGRRTLLVIDNATSEAQVRPLLPTGAGSTALLTSRRLPVGLSGLRPVVLSVPGLDDACAMFEAATALARPVDDPEAVARIGELCGALPLAIRVAAAQLAARPHWSAGTLADRLADERGRLAHLVAGDVDVRAALLAAYHEVPAAHRRAFRLLGLVPRGAFGLWLAAAVLGVAAREAERLVEALVEARLLEVARVDGARPDRYQLHELWRLLAVELLADESPAVVRDATERMCEAYADASGYADALLAPGRRGAVAACGQGGTPVGIGAFGGDVGKGAGEYRWWAVGCPGQPTARGCGTAPVAEAGARLGAGPPGERRPAPGGQDTRRPDPAECWCTAAGAPAEIARMAEARPPTVAAPSQPMSAGPVEAYRPPAPSLGTIPRQTSGVDVVTPRAVPTSAGGHGPPAVPRADGSDRANGPVDNDRWAQDPLGQPRWSPSEPAPADRAWHTSAVGHDPLSWFAAEQTKLVAVAVAAHAARLWRPTIRLADSLSHALEARAAWDDWHTTHTLALDAARRCGDRRATARLLRSLGDLAWQRRRLGEARECYQRSRLAAWEVADPREYGRTLVALAELCLDTGEFADASRLLDSALAVVSTPMDARGRYAALRALSLLAVERGDLDAAERSFGECLELAGALRDRRLEDYARRALRALRTGRLGEPAGDRAGHWARPSGVEVRPGVWRLRTPAIS